MSEGLSEKQLACLEDHVYAGLPVNEALALLREVWRLQAECRRRAVLVAWDRDGIDTCEAARMLGCDPSIPTVDRIAATIAAEGRAAVETGQCKR